MAEITTTLVMETRATRYHFRNNSTSGLMVHEITRGVVVTPGQKATKTMQLSINNPTIAIAIFTTMIIIEITDGVGQKVK